MWTLCIAVFLLITVVFNVQAKERIALKIEILFHCCVWSIALLFTLLPIIGLTYGRSGLWCWIDGNETLGVVWIWITFYGPLWLLIIAVIIIYLTIAGYLLYRRKKLLDLTQGSNDMFARDIKVYMRLFGYPLIFLLVWLFPTINRLYQSISGGQFSFTLVLLHALFDQLQGFFNCILYFFNPVEVLCHCRKNIEGDTIEFNTKTSNDLGTSTAIELQDQEYEITAQQRDDHGMVKF
jgi:hypothetical protein